MEKFYLDVDGINTKILKFESKTNTKNLLILHGWGGKSESWIVFSEALREEGFNVFVPDLPGFGETSLPREFFLDDYSIFVNNLILKLGIDEFYLFGHSNGGAISVKLLSKFDVKVKKLILNNSAGIRNTKEISLKRKLFKILFSPFKISKNTSFYKYFKINFYKLIGNHDYLNSLMKPFLEETYKNIIGEDITHLLKDLNVETLLLRGEKDTFTPMSYGKIFEKNIINSKFISIDGEGHSIHLKNPGELLKNFINNI